MENKKSDNAGTAERSAFSRMAVTVIGTTAAVAGLLSFVLIPTMQGREEGLDIFTALCRAIGLERETPSSATGKTSGSTVAFDENTRWIVAAGDPASGEELAGEVCAVCHLPNGLTADPQTIPTITGQSARAIYKQLRDIKAGVRASETMKPIADELDEKKMSDLAAYYSGLPRRNRSNPENPVVSRNTVTLVESGDAARALPACAACHEARAGGPVEAPHLTGQYPVYFEAQLKAYAEGRRRNDLYGRMRSIASKLTPQEIRELGAYYNAPRYPRF
jgi:cytochrome c553